MGWKIIAFEENGKILTRLRIFFRTLFSQTHEIADSYTDVLLSARGYRGQNILCFERGLGLFSTFLVES